ncbi:hypothetical protein AB0J80_26865 [Actinoplanes sp. NPDC049548]|uniref:hypothetical protein n=1 Tax=Actinoplanes sp. NPDC049548 TaxID=3155152 RepID=UPI0034336D55
MPEGRLYAYLMWRRLQDAAILALVAGGVLALVLVARRRPARIAPDGPATR